MHSLTIPVSNVLTIDVEDWYHVCGLPQAPVIGRDQRRVRQAVERILNILSRAGVKATFFVLGCVAEEEPDLVPTMAREGHEIASHGWSHRLVHQLSEQEFRAEIRRTGEILKTQGGKQPIGFRAPQWSVSRLSPPWVFSILQEEGYRYDSSMNPLPFVGDRRGERRPFQLETGRGLVEFPPLVLQTVAGNLPVGGGWGFRFFPLAMVREAVTRMNRAGDPAVLYLHPREVDPSGPRLRLPPLKKFATYGTRTDATERVGRLLREFQFTTLERLVSTWHSV